MTFEEHRLRHLDLFRALDELLADFLSGSPVRDTFKTNIQRLYEWSFVQTLCPDPDPHPGEAGWALPSKPAAVDSPTMNAKPSRSSYLFIIQTMKRRAQRELETAQQNLQALETIERMLQARTEEATAEPKEAAQAAEPK